MILTKLLPASMEYLEAFCDPEELIITSHNNLILLSAQFLAFIALELLGKALVIQRLFDCGVKYADMFGHERFGTRFCVCWVCYLVSKVS